MGEKLSVTQNFPINSDLVFLPGMRESLVHDNYEALLITTLQPPAHWASTSYLEIILGLFFLNACPLENWLCYRRKTWICIKFIQELLTLQTSFWNGTHLSVKELLLYIPMWQSNIFKILVLKKKNTPSLTTTFNHYLMKFYYYNVYIKSLFMHENNKS